MLMPIYIPSNSLNGGGQQHTILSVSNDKRKRKHSLSVALVLSVFSSKGTNKDCNSESLINLFSQLMVVFFQKTGVRMFRGKDFQ